ncbi:hypothetical protein D3C86_1044210 [compost metagenome]
MGVDQLVEALEGDGHPFAGVAHDHDAVEEVLARAEGLRELGDGRGVLARQGGAARVEDLAQQRGGGVKLARGEDVLAVGEPAAQGRHGKRLGEDAGVDRLLTGGHGETVRLEHVAEERFVVVAPQQDQGRQLGLEGPADLGEETRLGRAVQLDNARGLPVGGRGGPEAVVGDAVEVVGSDRPRGIQLGRVAERCHQLLEALELAVLAFHPAVGHDAPGIPALGQRDPRPVDHDRLAGGLGLGRGLFELRLEAFELGRQDAIALGQAETEQRAGEGVGAHVGFEAVEVFKGGMYGEHRCHGYSLQAIAGQRVSTKQNQACCGR